MHSLWLFSPCFGTNAIIKMSMALFSDTASVRDYETSRVISNLNSFWATEQALFNSERLGFPSDVTASPELVRFPDYYRGASCHGRLDLLPVFQFPLIRCLVSLAGQRNLVLYDGCIGADNVTECHLVMNGLFRNGLHSANVYLISAGLDVVNALKSPNFTALTPQVIS